MKILILDGHTLNPGDNPWEPLAGFGELEIHARTTPEEIVERAAGAAIIVTNKAPLSRETLLALPELKFIAVTATGHNIVDGKTARELGIPVSNVPTYSTDTVAQHAFALILELCHRTAAHHASVVAGDWAKSPDFCYWNAPLVELKGRRLGIVGRGRIGRRLAELARAFGMDARFASTSKPQGGEGLEAIDALFADSDIVSLHCALTPANERFVDAALLARMKPGSFLVNTARGALIDEAALAHSLASGQLAGAALDVLSKEPPPSNNPLIGCPNCIITPHMAWTGRQARQTLMSTTADNIRAFLQGHPQNVVN